jgi:hypothetical protein
MAATNYWSDAIAVLAAQPGVRSTIVEALGSTICNMAMSRIWNAADWRESITKLPPFFLIGQEQDYYAPQITKPPDYYGLRECRVIYMGESIPYRTEQLTVAQDLALTDMEGTPTAICYQRSNNGFRVFPRPPANYGCTDWAIEGTYKKHPTKITGATIPTALIPWDDTYFDVVVQAVKWAYAHVSGSPNAPQLVQELALYVNDMAEREGFNMGNPQIAPGESLADDPWGGGFGGFF